MGVVKVIVNGTTKMDITPTTATASDVASSKIFFNREGTQTTGTSGGGGQSVSPKQVNFIDYDGTILYAYTAQEANALSTLPANPSHSGLTAQGWNWTLQEIKAQLTAVPSGDVWVGQMYITQSGNTEIDCIFDNPDYLAPYLTIAVNGSVTVDWGDNTVEDTVTGTSLTTLKYTRHTYANIGQYTITITVNSGTFAFYNTQIKPSVLSISGAESDRRYSRVYARCVTAIRLGESVSVGNYAFTACCALQSITIPDSVTSIGSATFQYCYALQSVIIPNSVTSIGVTTFATCYALQSVTIPAGVTSIVTSMFSSCYSLTSITIPDGITSIGNSAFQNCYALQSVTIPAGVTSIGNNAFYNCFSLQSITIPDSVTSISGSAFYNCYSLRSVTIPDSVTSIGGSAFGYCYDTREYHIKPTSVPTGGTSMFLGIIYGTVIYVPSAKLNDYKTATNWSTYASYMQGE